MVKCPTDKTVTVLHEQLPEVCEPPEVCVPITDGMPTDIPGIGDSTIRYDPCTKQLWVYVCDSGWRTIGLNLCQLEELDPGVINDICNTLRIPAFYDSNGCCAQGGFTLQEIADLIVQCAGISSCIPSHVEVDNETSLPTEVCAGHTFSFNLGGDTNCKVYATALVDNAVWPSGFSWHFVERSTQTDVDTWDSQANLVAPSVGPIAGALASASITSGCKPMAIYIKASWANPAMHSGTLDGTVTSDIQVALEVSLNGAPVVNTEVFRLRTPTADVTFNSGAPQFDTVVFVPANTTYTVEAQAVVIASSGRSDRYVSVPVGSVQMYGWEL